MNCKPGDLARLVIPGDLYGALFSVIEAAPVGTGFQLPDGTLHQPTGANGWIVESLGSKVPARYWSNGVPTRVFVRFGAVDDKYLRPIRDNDGEDQTLTWAGKPSDIKTPEAA